MTIGTEGDMRQGTEPLADNDELLPGLVLVTHHVEEIPEGITHALLLRKGLTIAAGVIGEVLTGPLVSAAFDVDVDIDHSDGRFACRVDRNRSGSAEL